MTPEELRAHIDTIAIVMMENRSFDHMFGCLRLPEHGGRHDVNGIESLGNPDYANPSQNAAMFAPFVAAHDQLVNDLPHSRRYVAQQLAASAIAGGFTMTGFVTSYEAFTGTSGVLTPPPMGLLAPVLLPVTHFFAREYTLCDAWFAPLPTSTQPNRLMALSGDVFHDGNQHGLIADQDLMFDWLDRHGVSWRIYSAGFSFFALMPKLWPALLSGRCRPLHSLALDVQHEPAATFPQVIFIEPDYDDAPVQLSGHACDNHPPVPVAHGEAFLKSVYDALSSDAQRWSKTVLVYTYDEHGGFYDHVAPPRIPYAPPAGAQFDAAFTSTGPRVPGLLISPHAARGQVAHDLFDHTSVLQLLAERFGPSPASYSRSVDARRAAGIRSLSSALSVDARADIPRAPAPPPTAQAAAGPRLRKEPKTKMQRSFVAAMEGLSHQHGAAATARFPEIGHWLARR